MAYAPPAKRARLDHSATASPTTGQHVLNLPAHASLNPHPPHFSQPQLLTTFSYDAERRQHFDNSSLKYFKPPQEPRSCDLGRGFDEAIWKPEGAEGPDALLHTLERLGEEHDQLLDSIKLISWRGLVTKFATTAYETREPWSLSAQLFDDCLYLQEEKEVEDFDDTRRKLMYYGYAFESYCTTAAKPSELAKGAALPPDEEPGWGGNVNTNVQWCAICRTCVQAVLSAKSYAADRTDFIRNLEGMRMILGGEVDCVTEARDPNKPLASDQFVELKTNMTIKSEKDEVKFEKFKMIKFYMQSYLLGVSRIFVGFRTPEGQLATVQPFNTLELPRCVRGKPHEWNPNIALRTASAMLAFAHQTLRSDEETQAAQTTFNETLNGQKEGRHEGLLQWPTFRISFRPGQRGSRPQVVVERAAAARQAKGEEAEGSTTRIGLLPASYVQSVATRKLRLQAK